MLSAGYNPAVKRLYWTNPDIYEIEVETRFFGNRKITIELIVFNPDEE
jgi:hypothetical protein